MFCHAVLTELVVGYLQEYLKVLKSTWKYQNVLENTEMLKCTKAFDFLLLLWLVSVTRHNRSYTDLRDDEDFETRGKCISACLKCIKLK